MSNRSAKSLSPGTSTHQMRLQFNIKCSVQPQSNEVLESLIKFVQKWKSATGASGSLEMCQHFKNKVLKVLTILESNCKYPPVNSLGKFQSHELTSRKQPAMWKS